MPKAHAATYTYYRSITVTSSAANASGTNANFPMLVSSTLVSWESSSTGAGARIQNLCTAPNGNQEPCDLIFVTSTPTASGGAWNCGTSLNFETESYTPSTGSLIDWVNVPTMASSAVIYACYDNTSLTTDQSHPSSTWNGNYLAVYHFPGALGLNDSTANAHTLANDGSDEPVASTSQYIDGGALYLSTGVHDLSTGAFTMGTTLTVEAWVNRTSTGNMVYVEKSPINASWVLFNDASLELRGGNSNNTLSATLPSPYVWHHIVGSITGTTGKLYVDGLIVSSGTVDAVGNTSTAVHLGTYDDSGFPFAGSMDEVRISNSVLSDNWVFTEYNNQNSPPTFYAIGAETAVSAATVAIPHNIILTMNW